MMWATPVLALLVLPQRLSPRLEHVSTLDTGGGLSCRRGALIRASSLATAIWCPRPCQGADGISQLGKVRVTLSSPQDRLGLELVPVAIGDQTMLAIRRNISGKSSALQAGMILKDYASMDQLQAKLQKGPYPVTLTFQNLAAGGDATSDTGAPLVTAQDALELAQRTSTPSTGATSTEEFQIQVLSNKNPSCRIKSRRNDVLEINYVASFADKNIDYDASQRRGTGQAYQMVLGSGDMLPGVDLGLYDMCPGEVRRLVIPPRLAYGAKGNKMFGVPPHQTLVWQVELVRINGVVGTEDDRSRDEMEERVPYSNPR